jgi:hypothetical protein
MNEQKRTHACIEARGAPMTPKAAAAVLLRGQQARNLCRLLVI